MKTGRPKLVIIVVYKTTNNKWRGFCAPYDITCNTDSQEEAITAIENLTELYEEGLRKYNFPEHLSVKPLTNKSDREVFKFVIAQIAKDISQRMTERFLDYERSQSKKMFEFENATHRASGTYYESMAVPAG